MRPDSTPSTSTTTVSKWHRYRNLDLRFAVIAYFPKNKCQAILDCEIPTLPPGRFSPELCDFVRQCLYRDPDRRLPGEVLLGAPWLQKFGATSYDASVEIVRDWIHSITGEHK